MKRLSAACCFIFLLSLALSAGATTITFEETVADAPDFFQAGKTSEVILSSDGLYRAVAYWWSPTAAWHSRDFTLQYGGYNPSSQFSEAVIFDIHNYIGIYIERVDNAAFDLVSMDFAYDSGAPGRGGVAVSTSSDFENASWQYYTVDGLYNIVPPGPNIKTLSFGSDFTGVTGVFLESGYPFATRPNVDFYDAGIWDNIVLESASSGGGAAPEPSTLLLLGFGLIGLAGRCRKKT